jgi:hypothetical protein
MIHNVSVTPSEELIGSGTPYTHHQEEEARRKNHLSISYPK